jgi:uncharacterized membrane protein
MVAYAAYVMALVPVHVLYMVMAHHDHDHAHAQWDHVHRALLVALILALVEEALVGVVMMSCDSNDHITYQ